MLGVPDAVTPDTPLHSSTEKSFRNGREQDGAPAPILETSSAAFHGSCVGRVVSILWPRRLLEFTPLDLFFLEYVTNCVWTKLET